MVRPKRGVKFSDGIGQFFDDGFILIGRGLGVGGSMDNALRESFTNGLQPGVIGRLIRRFNGKNRLNEDCVKIAKG